jgi:hypothetical protein
MPSLPWFSASKQLRKKGTQSIMKITVEYPFGFIETAPSVSVAEHRIRESSHTGTIEPDTSDPGRYQEYRDIGPDGEGWYFAGRIHIQES